MAYSPTSSTHNFKYDVFLSFCGRDVRKGFLDHLYHALDDRSIITFKDDVTLKIGSPISKELLQSIQDSKIYIIIFSKNYASSSWCLDELVKIIECNEMKEHTACPVFYDVEPTEVRHQTGHVEKALAKHEGANVGKWTKALTEAANLEGLVLNNKDDAHEGRFVKRIADYIFRELQSTKIYIDKTIVGMERRVEVVLSSIETGIDEVRMIGISGIGGGGKTTLAKAVFNKISTRFEGISFVEDIREVSKKSGLQSLQKQVILDVSEKEMFIHSVSHGKNMIMNILRGKKVLIVLDDVDHNDQLVALIGEPNWYKAGSRIIITARDKRVLIPYVVMPIHEVDLLSDEEAKGLFSRFAFRGDTPDEEYQVLSEEAVQSAGGLPLYIQALGLYLYGKSKLEWRDKLDTLKSIPLEDSNKRLELSYVDLKKTFQDIFLDVACFLKGLHKEEAIRILEICGRLGAINGLRDLEEKSLIKISSDQHLDMHDHIQGMGRYIVQRTYPDNPERHSRLWESEKIEEILDNEWVSEETSGIALDECLTSDIVAKGFANIKHLRFLRMISERDENAHHVSQYFPSTLRYLRWEFYPDSSLPRRFQPNNLVALEMYECKIQRLWEGEEKKVLKKLKFLVLSHSKLTFLDLDLTPNLEKLDLEECQYLVNIHMGELGLQKLVSLNLTGCSSIDSLSFISQLKSLEILHLSNLSLEEFPDIISGPDNSLLELHFRENNIKELPSSIGNLKNLVVLDFHGCRKLRSLPRSICGLQDLKNLDLHSCTLKELPEDIGHLKCLENLDLSNAHITHLPDSISMLVKLINLNLTNCWYLERLPEDLGRLDSLEKLILTECTQLEYIPDSICNLKNLKCLSLLNCVKLKDLPEGLELLECLEELYVKGTCIELPPGLLSLRNLKTDQASSSSVTLKASSSNKRQKIYHK